MLTVAGAQLGEFTIGWFILSVVMGGILGAVLKYLFEVRLVEIYKSDLHKKEIVKRYSYPLLQAASDVELRLDSILSLGIKYDWLSSRILKELHEGKGFLKDPSNSLGYYFVSTLYVFSRYFAWIEILKLKTGFLDFPQGQKKTNFYSIMNKINNAFRYTELWISTQKDGKSYHDSQKLYRHIQASIGEIMITERNGEYTSLSFLEFVKRYSQTEDSPYRFWIRNLETYFVDLCEIDSKNIGNELENKGEFRLIRLAAIQYWFYQLVVFLDPKFERVQAREANHSDHILARIPATYREAIINLPQD